MATLPLGGNERMFIVPTQGLLLHPQSRGQVQWGKYKGFFTDLAWKWDASPLVVLYWPEIRTQSHTHLQGRWEESPVSGNPSPVPWSAHWQTCPERLATHCSAGAWWSSVIPLILMGNGNQVESTDQVLRRQAWIWPSPVVFIPARQQGSSWELTLVTKKYREGGTFTWPPGCRQMSAGPPWAAKHCISKGSIFKDGVALVKLQREREKKKTPEVTIHKSNTCKT